MSVFTRAPVESPADAQPLAASETSFFAFAPGRLRAWGLKSALSFVDYGLTSAAGCHVGTLGPNQARAAETMERVPSVHSGCRRIMGNHHTLLYLGK